MLGICIIPLLSVECRGLASWYAVMPLLSKFPGSDPMNESVKFSEIYFSIK